MKKGKLGVIELLEKYQGGNVILEFHGEDFRSHAIIRKMEILEIKRKYIKLQSQEDLSTSDILLDESVSFKILKHLQKEIVIEIHQNGKELFTYKMTLKK
ncbi:hypothetical protein COE94_25565 [Bacillus toyonensis]|uniref:hypothetical protein n=1 Tax=Bacillus TaxID=1386 RepID=UPI000BEFE5D8|nr:MULTISPECIES: hypothetical protein [Bacillus]MCG3797357.1 hypothetical protein [Bacillus toyonensis]MDA1877470.1 hypothetical protein [Bacillus cereus group sp. BY112LC]PEL72460.1 hypothetical protein CN603_24330 [Bacillus toyonensis]PFX63438.1 hypothetical protein COL35_28500 [Bacillus toyonensis]PHB81074.1 hypothetical protein COE94_25565 [Bacillus toyonensis]